MKFLIIGDLHGNKPKIYYKNFDAIIAPGDFCSDKGIREAYQIEYKEFLKNPYKHREWWEIVGKTKAKKLILNSIKKGREILKFLNSFNVPVYIVPGNWDLAVSGKEKWKFMDKNFFKNYVTKGLKNIINLHKRLIDVGSYQIIGYGLCNGPELYKYRGYTKIMKKKDILRNRKNYKNLFAKYNGLFKRAKHRLKPIIFLSHNVPFNTPLDKITDKKSLRYGYHYGSLIAKKMVKKYQPLVFIGAHMHEHFEKCRIGKTICINSGFGSYVNIWLQLEENKIKKLEFYREKR